jgi:adenylate cyclase
LAQIERKLAAVMLADIAGYSTLMERSETRTFERVRTMHEAVVNPSVTRFGGRIIKTTGDGFLAEFPSGTAALLCGIDIQRVNYALEAEKDEADRFHLRIGINLGDIIIDGDDISGDGVNVAARLEPLAPKDGICVSGAVRDQIREDLDVVFEDLGDQQVKNISRPIRAYRISLTEGPSATVANAGPPTVASSAVLSLPDKPSIAVLPFNNMSGDPEQDYFADGMVEDIITALARMGWFFVIARNSSFVYKGKTFDIKQVGRELGVQYVVEGSVRKSGGRVRITGQLIEAESGRHVWADRFDGSADDVFELQDRITESIVTAIEPNMMRAEIERSRVTPAANLRAYDLVMRSLPGLWPGATRAAIDESMSFVRRALELDPHYARAKATVALLCWQRIVEGYGEAADVKTGLRYAKESLAEDKSDPNIQASAGLVIGSLGYRALGFPILGFHYDEAEHAMERALLAGPNLMTVQLLAGALKNFLGDGDAAIGHLERAMRLSPIDPFKSAFVAGIGVAHLRCGRYEEARLWLQRSIQESPNYVLALSNLVLALGFLGKIPEAKTVAQHFLELVPHFTVSRYLSVIGIKDPEFRKRAGKTFRAAGVPR